MDRKEALVDAALPATFRRYQATDYDALASLWTRINRELAPAGMEQLFEQYIATTINGELKPGKYTVAWHAVGDDTHHVEGKYNFEVKP